MKPKFQVGDRVVNLPSISRDGYYPDWFIGRAGTVCHIFTEYGIDETGELYGVDYDDELGPLGHRCDGYARLGHGRNIRGAFLELEETPILVDPSALL